jgi:urease subunit alpha
MTQLDPAAYARTYGPTVGDRVRLGDTSLVVEVERDDAKRGEEVLPGFAKTARDGLSARATTEACDAVIVNALVLDPLLGVRKTSIGIRHGRVAAVGRAGNPDTMDGIEVVLGTGTAIYSGEGLIATPGAIDTHVHMLSPRICDAALASGVTTIVGQDFGPVWNLGTNPAWALGRMSAATDAWPINVAFLARGSSSRPEPLEAALAAGAAGLKIHEDVGAHRTALDTALRVAEAHDVQVAVHTDGLNECLSVEDTLEVLAGRTIHAFHIEGCGGGHAPDVLRLLGEPNVICSSTNPTIPFGVNAVAEHGPMVFTVHALQAAFPDDAAIVADRVRAGTMAAEGVLHDLGLIAITSSDSQGMGRVGETVRRTFQLASKLRDERGADDRHDNERVLRYLAKCTINPALAHGLSHEVGALTPGRLADVVLWRPEWFGVKPSLVLKSGFPAWGATGDPNAVIDFCEPVVLGPQFGAHGGAAAELSVLFTSRAALAGGGAARLPSRKRRSVVSGTRTVGARDMVRHGRLGAVRVDPTTHEVTLDGEPLRSPPSATVPLSSLYLLG